MTKQAPLMPTTEIIGAIMMPTLSEDDMKRLQEDAHSFFVSALNVEFEEGIKVSLQENSDSTIHIALPYYDLVHDVASVELSDEDMKAVAGGEIFISICIAIGAGVGIIVSGAIPAASAIGCIVTGVAVGSVAGAAATGGMIHGAIQENKKKGKKSREGGGGGGK